MLRRTVTKSLFHSPLFLLAAHSAGRTISLSPVPQPQCHATSDSCSVAKNEGLSIAMPESDAVMFGSMNKSAATSSVHEEQGRSAMPDMQRQRVHQSLNTHRSTTGAAHVGLSLRNGNTASRRSNSTLQAPTPSYSAMEAMVSDMAPTASMGAAQHLDAGASALTPSSYQTRPWHTQSPMRCDGCSTHSNHQPPLPSNPIHDSELHAAAHQLPTSYSATIQLTPHQFAFDSTLPSTFVNASRLVEPKNHSSLRHSDGNQQRNKIRERRSPLVAPSNLNNQATKHRKSKSTIGNSKENASPDGSQYAFDADRMSYYPSPMQTSSDVTGTPSATVKRQQYHLNATYHNPNSTASMMHRVPTCSFDSPHFGSITNHNTLNGSIIGVTGMMAASTVAVRPNSTMRSMSFMSSVMNSGEPSSSATHLSNQRRFYTSDRIIRTPPEQRVVSQEPNGNGGMGYREEFHKAISRRLLEGVRRGAIDPADVADNLHHVPDTRKTVLYPQNKSIPLNPVEEAMMTLDAAQPSTLPERPQMPGATISISPTVGHSYTAAPEPSNEALLTKVLKEEADMALSRQGIRDVYESTPLEKPPTADIGPIADLETENVDDAMKLRPVNDFHKMSDDDRFAVNTPTERASSHSIVRDSDSNYNRLRRKSSLQPINRELRKLRKQTSVATATGPTVSKILPPAVTRDADGYAILNVTDIQPSYSSSPVSKDASRAVIPDGTDDNTATRVDKLEELYAKVEPPHQQASIVLPDAAVDSFAIGGRAQLLKFADSTLGAKVLTKRRRDRVRRKLGSEAVMGIAVASSGHTGNTEFIVSPEKKVLAPPSPAVREVAGRRLRRLKKTVANATHAESEQLAAAPYNKFLSENDRLALSVQSDENYRISNNPTRNEPTMAPTAFGLSLSQVPGLPEGVQMRTSDGRVRISPDKESKWWVDIKRKRWISRGMGGQTRDANRGIRYYKP